MQFQFENKDLARQLEQGQKRLARSKKLFEDCSLQNLNISSPFPLYLQARTDKAFDQFMFVKELQQKLQQDTLLPLTMTLSDFPEFASLQIPQWKLLAVNYQWTMNRSKLQHVTIRHFNSQFRKQDITEIENAYTSYTNILKRLGESEIPSLGVQDIQNLNYYSSIMKHHVQKRKRFLKELAARINEFASVLFVKLGQISKISSKFFQDMSFEKASPITPTLLVNSFFNYSIFQDAKYKMELSQQSGSSAFIRGALKGMQTRY